VELATVAHPAAVADALASVVCAREQANRQGVEAVAARLADRPVLLILDNCEQVVEACATAVAFLLTRCARLQVLATSREPLAVPGERVWPLAPLAGPAAFELFVARAEAQRFTVTPDSEPAVAEICRRLDGIPLAIELAAARVGFLNPEQIAARLDDPFRLLSTGSRAPARRHRTLLGALEWSHDLLSESERIVFRRLAVFAGGFSLEAAEAVCAGDDVEPAAVADVVGRLAAQSLVGPSVPRGRCRLLDPIRAFARQKLEAAGESVRTRDAHAVWCVGLLRSLVRGQAGLERVGADYANLTAALDWTLSSGRTDDALDLTGSLIPFWLAQGRMTEGSAWLERALDAGTDAAPRLRIKALFGAGALSGMLGDFDRAAAAGQESLGLARSAGDRRGEARALNLLGFVASYLDPDGARTLLRDSTDAAREVGDQRCLASGLGLLGFVEVFQGNYPAARPYFDKCLAVAAEADDQQALRMALVGTGYVAMQRGAFAASEAALVQGLELARQQGDAFYVAIALCYLGELSRIRVDSKQAIQWAEEALAVARETGSTLMIGFCLSFLGRAVLEAGEPAEALVYLEEALALPRGTGNPGHWPWALVGLGRAHLALADLAQAGGLLDDGVAAAQARGHRLATAWALSCSARFARATGAPGTAAEMAHGALDLSVEMGHPAGTATALEILAGLALSGNTRPTAARPAYAARLFGAADAIRKLSGCACPPLDQADREADIARAAAALPAGEFTATWNQGAGLSVEEATAYAGRGRGSRRRPASGWASLTPAELDVVRLVADGLTNVEIGQRLFVSPRTVQTHLAHVFAKLDVHSRRDVTRAAADQAAR
jgi:predicted ATPase/DNA-binding CsgD family transcriptional regulator